MSGALARAVHPSFPNLSGEVAEGYLSAPPGTVAEVIDGQLSLLPRPRARHAVAATALSGELRRWFRHGGDGPGGWVMLIEPELRLGTRPDLVAPDIAAWRRDRFPMEALDEDAAGAIEVAPDWVCEVLSRSTEAHDRGPKRRVYQRERVGHIWYVNPMTRTLEALRWEQEGYVLVDTWEGDASVRAEPFDAVELRLELLWNV